MKKPTPPRDLWEQMDEITGAPHKDDEGKTILEFAQRHNITPCNAAKKLHALVKEGLLIEGRKKAPRGKFVKVFRPA
jgi:hypothetical protein